MWSKIITWCANMQDNQLTGTLDAYVDALSAAESPSATRFLSLGGNRLSGGVPDSLSNLGAFQPGAWNILDGWMFQKTLNISSNDFNGPLPVWALQRSTADEGLTVELAVRPLTVETYCMCAFAHWHKRQLFDIFQFFGLATLASL